MRASRFSHLEREQGDRDQARDRARTGRAVCRVLLGAARSTSKRGENEVQTRTGEGEHQQIGLSRECGARRTVRELSPRLRASTQAHLHPEARLNAEQKRIFERQIREEMEDEDVHRECRCAGGGGGGEVGEATS